MSEEKKIYAPEAYLVAAFWVALNEISAEAVRTMNHAEDFSNLFLENFGVDLDEVILSRALFLMDDLNLIRIDEDVYAGQFITLQKTSFSSQFKEVAEQVPDSPLATVLRGRRQWIEQVLDNAAFWEEARKPSATDGETLDEQVPASDRMVTLLHNSPERLEIATGLEALSESLRTNNEVAAELGDDRERISAELEASRAGIQPERIRAGFIRETVLKVLRELGTKLKDKAMELGVDRLIVLFETLLDNLF